MNNWTPENFADLVAYWLHIHGLPHKSASSLKRDQGILKNYLIPEFGEEKLQNITINKIEEWFALLTLKGISRKSCNDVLGLLKKVLSDGERWGYLEKNPASLIKKLKVEEKDFQFWNADEVKRYLSYWHCQQEVPRIYWAVVLGLYTGMRRGEIMALKWDCIDEGAGLITVKRSYCRILKGIKEETKSKRIRRIPMNTMLKSKLTQVSSITRESGFVCPHIPADRYHIEFKASVNIAGINIIRFHDLRHTFASNFLAGGGNIYDLQKMLGHSTVQVTERYCHMIPDQLAGKTEVLKF